MIAYHAGKFAATFACVGTVLALTYVGARNLGQAGAREAGKPLTYFVSEGEDWSGYRPSDRELATWALEVWERNAAGAFRLTPVAESEALVRIYWARPNGSYGETRPFGTGSDRGAAVFVRPSLDGLPEAVARLAMDDPLWRDTIVYLTCLHETGHALGLSHTADQRDIMYSFGYGGDIVEYFARFRRKLTVRQDIPAAGGLSEADVQRLRAIRPAH
jgi:hypothetical protein